MRRPGVVTLYIFKTLHMVDYEGYEGGEGKAVRPSLRADEVSSNWANSLRGVS